jgi:RNase H-fold protein (predicted Holliday junction resolvase)
VIACLSENDYLTQSQVEKFHDRLHSQYSTVEQVVDPGAMEPPKKRVAISHNNSPIPLSSSSGSNTSVLTRKVRPPIFDLTSRFVNEQLGNAVVTPDTVKLCFQNAFTDEQETVDHCLKLYEEYIPEQLAENHEHFDYSTLFNNFVPFNALVLTDQNTEQHKQKLLNDATLLFRQYRLESPMVSMITFKSMNLGVPFERYDIKTTSHQFWFDLRQRFATYVYFHDPRAEGDVTIEELFPTENEYKLNAYTVNRQLFEKLYGRYSNPITLDNRAEFFTVMGISRDKANKLNEFIARARGNNLLPISGDAYMFLLCTLHYMFKNDKDANLKNWKYQYLIASLSYGSSIHDRHPCHRLFQEKKAFRFTKKQYQTSFSDVLNEIDMDQVDLATKFVVGLKFCAHVNQWFGLPFTEQTVVNAMLMFSGCKYARLWKSRESIRQVLRREEQFVCYQTICDAIKILVN